MLANSSILPSAYFRDFLGVFDRDQGVLDELTLFGQDEREEVSISRSDYQVKLVGELLPPTRREDLTDDETVLLEFRQRGQNCFPTINGSFAIAAWDPEERTLFLARDSAGTIPIYYHIRGSRVLFGTSLRSLENHAIFRRELNFQAVGEFLFFLYIAAPSCIFKDTYKVPASSFVCLGPSKIKTNFYPRVEEDTKEMSPEQAKSIVQPVLTEAIRRCLQPEYQNAICLSGGIDSSTIAAIAAKMDSPLFALTAQFNNFQLDESRFAKKVSAHLGIDQESIPVETNKVVEDVTRIYDVFDEPVAAIQHFALMRASERTETILLDGSGADGLLGVPPPHRAQRAYLVGGLVPSTIRQFAVAALTRSPFSCLRNVGWLFDYENLEDLLGQYNGWPRDTLPDGCNIKEAYYFQLYRQWKDRTDLFGLYTLLYSVVWGPSEVIPKGAVAARRLGYVIRFPFEDIDFRRTINELPRSVKYNAGETKTVLRSILKDYLPPFLYERKKHGFRQPILSILRHGNYQLIREYLDPKQIQKQGILDSTVIREAVAKFQAGDRREGWRLWAVLLLELFLKTRVG